MSDVQISAQELWDQAANQINVVNNLAALETQSDVVSFTLQSIVTDLKAWSGTGPITWSANTTNGITALQAIEAQSSISTNDITNSTTSTPIQATVKRKQATRSLQAKYYALKAKFGL